MLELKLIYSEEKVQSKTFDMFLRRALGTIKLDSVWYVSTNPFREYTVVGTSREEMLHLADPHWYSYPAMDPLWIGVLGLATFCLRFFAEPGNPVVIGYS